MKSLVIPLLKHLVSFSHYENRSKTLKLTNVTFPGRPHIFAPSVVWSKQEKHALRKNKPPRFALQRGLYFNPYCFYQTITAGFRVVILLQVLTPSSPDILWALAWSQEVAGEVWIGCGDSQLGFRHCPAGRQEGTCIL